MAGSWLLFRGYTRTILLYDRSTNMLCNKRYAKFARHGQFQEKEKDSNY